MGFLWVFLGISKVLHGFSMGFYGFNRVFWGLVLRTSDDFLFWALGPFGVYFFSRGS